MLQTDEIRSVLGSALSTDPPATAGGSDARQKSGTYQRTCARQQTLNPDLLA